MSSRVPSVTVLSVVACKLGSDRKRSAEPVPVTMASPPMNKPSGVAVGASVGSGVIVGKGVTVGRGVTVGVTVTTTSGCSVLRAALKGRVMMIAPITMSAHRPVKQPISGPSHNGPPLGRLDRAWTRRTVGTPSLCRVVGSGEGASFIGLVNHGMQMCVWTSSIAMPVLPLWSPLLTTPNHNLMVCPT
jgi:hypothetical protein